MTPSPEPPEEDKTKSQHAHPNARLASIIANQNRQHPLSKHPDTVAEVPDLGETLLPFLFAAMEACWIDAIFIGLASINLFQSHDTLIPLWGPFVLIICSQLILSLLERRSRIACCSNVAA